MADDQSFRTALDNLEAGEKGAPAEEPRAGADPREAGHPTVVALAEHFGDGVLHWELASRDEHVVFIRPELNVEVLGWLRDDPSQRYLFLLDVTCVDYGGGRPIQVVYQLWSLELKRQLRVKAELPLSSLEIDSVVPLWKTADWLEREAYDMFGVRFRGHPDLRRILMPETYAEGHPLRKDFPLRGRFSRAEQTRRALSMETEDHYTPQELVFMKEAGQEPPPADAGPGATQAGPPGIVGPATPSAMKG